MSKKFTILLYFSNLPFSKIEHKHTLFFPFLVLVVARYCKTVYLRTHSRFVLVSGLSVSLCDNIFKNLYCRNVSPPKPHRRVGQESKFCLHLWAPSIIWCIAGKRVFFYNWMDRHFIHVKANQQAYLPTLLDAHTSTWTIDSTAVPLFDFSLKQDFLYNIFLTKLFSILVFGLPVFLIWL